MLRRLKSALETALPPKLERSIPCPVTPYQAALLGLLGAATRGAGLRGVNNTVMEMRKVVNDPLTSRLHVPGADGSLPNQCVPACVQLGGKMAVLAAALARLLPQGAPLSRCCSRPCCQTEADARRLDHNSVTSDPRATPTRRCSPAQATRCCSSAR